MPNYWARNSETGRGERGQWDRLSTKTKKWWLHYCGFMNTHHDPKSSWSLNSKTIREQQKNVLFVLLCVSFVWSCCLNYHSCLEHTVRLCMQRHPGVVTPMAWSVSLHLQFTIIISFCFFFSFIAGTDVAAKHTHIQCVIIKSPNLPVDAVSMATPLPSKGWNCCLGACRSSRISSKRGPALPNIPFFSSSSSSNHFPSKPGPSLELADMLAVIARREFVSKRERFCEIAEEIQRCAA